MSKIMREMYAESLRSRQEAEARKNEPVVKRSLAGKVAKLTTEYVDGPTTVSCDLAYPGYAEYLDMVNKGFICYIELGGLQITNAIAASVEDGIVVLLKNPGMHHWRRGVVKVLWKKA